MKRAIAVGDGRSSVEAGYMANCSRSSSVDTVKRVCVAGGEGEETEREREREREGLCREILRMRRNRGGLLGFIPLFSLGR